MPKQAQKLFPQSFLGRKDGYGNIMVRLMFTINRKMSSFWLLQPAICQTQRGKKFSWPTQPTPNLIGPVFSPSAELLPLGVMQNPTSAFWSLSRRWSVLDLLLPYKRRPCLKARATQNPTKKLATHKRN